jgi:hypothetical protein
VPATLVELIAELPPLQVQFFEALDRELTKVENFYRERENDAIVRSAIIKEQLDELKDHRKIFHVRDCTRLLGLWVIDKGFLPLDFRLMKINNSSQCFPRPSTRSRCMYRHLPFPGDIEKVIWLVNLPWSLQPAGEIMPATTHQDSTPTNINMPRRG